ncbi:MAG TPA: hypothetical protein V6D14_34200 [Coleofasciculaceae cyanobacterium]|jgi:hypothetical protein
MLRRLLQAATITFLLNLLAHLSPPNGSQPTAESSSQVTPKILMGFR